MKFEKQVTLKDVRDYLLLLSADPNFNADYSELVDLTDAETSELDFLKTTELAKVDPFSKLARRAFVAPRAAIFGITRMYQIVRQNEENMRSFKTMSAAREWLGLALSRGKLGTADSTADLVRS